MSNFSCAKCGAVWLDQSWLGYKTGCAHTMEEAMIPASPSFVCEHGSQRTKCPDCEVIALERELAAMTAERAAAIASWDEERERAQREGMRVVAAEAKNAALLIERDAAFKMSRCECAVEEYCGNLIAADDRAEKAEIKNVALLARLGQAHAALAHEICEHGALLERCRPVLVKVFNVRLSEVKDTLPTPLQEAASKLIGEIDAALKGKA